MKLMEDTCETMIRVTRIIFQLKLSTMEYGNTMKDNFSKTSEFRVYGSKLSFLHVEADEE